MTKNEKILRKALEMAIADYEFQIDAISGISGEQVSDHEVFAKERAKVYIERAKEALK